MPRKGERGKEGCARTERQGTRYEESSEARSAEEAWTKPKADICTHKTSESADSQCHKRRLSWSDGDK